MRRLKRRVADRLSGHFPQSEVQALVRLLCMELPGVRESDFYLENELPPDDSRDRTVDGWLERILSGEPVQYVLGYTIFHGMRISCDRRALIPRPETTELVEWIIGDESDRNLSGMRALDIGTGTGCIAIALAAHLPSCSVTAWDISRGALALAAENAAQNYVNVQFEMKDILSGPSLSGESRRFHLIVSNPPYIARHESLDMERNVLDFEPDTALFVPDGDPLLFYRNIAGYASSHLEPDGSLYFEINPLYAGQLEQMLESMGFAVTFRNDISGRCRMAKCRYL